MTKGVKQGYYTACILHHKECHQTVCKKCDMRYCDEFYSAACPDIKDENGEYHPVLVENKKLNQMNTRTIKEQSLEKDSIIAAAIEYLSMGYSVVPVGRDKTPVGQWKELQLRRMTPDEARRLFSQPQVGGVGIVTGEISGLVVLDVEAGEDISDLYLPPTATAFSGGGGIHFYFRMPKGMSIRNAGRIMGRKIDIRGEGGLIVAPPSAHPSGNHYAWKEGCAPNEIQLVDFPMKLVEEMKQPMPSRSGSPSLGVSQGQRNEVATRIAGKILGRLPETEWEDTAWPLLAGWNTLNDPPLDEAELRVIFDSIASSETTKRNHNNPDWHLWNLPDIFAHEFPTAEWLVTQLVPLNGITALSGNPSSYKSWLALEIAKSVAMGTNFLDRFPVMQGAVLIIDEEDQLQHLKKRFSQIGLPADAPMYYLSQNGVKLDNEYQVAKIRKIIEEQGIKLMIIDSLVRIHSQDENDARGMARVFRSFHELTSAGTTLLFIHHNRKAVIGQTGPQQNLRGSSGILAALDCHLAVEVKDKDVLIRQTKLRQAEVIPTFSVSIASTKNPDHISFAFKEVVSEREIRDQEIEAVILDLFSDEKQEWSRAEVLAAIEPTYGRNPTDRALKSLVAQKGLECPSAGTNGQAHLYRLAA